MSVSSNQYATKIFSEHPIACWPLDDDVSFLSIISEEERDISNQTYWTRQDCSVSTTTTPPRLSPFSSPDYYVITGDILQITQNDSMFSVELDDGISSSAFSDRLSNFSINLFSYIQSPYITYAQVGFKYWDDLSSQFIESYQNFSLVENAWNRIDAAFNYPQTTNPIDIFIRFFADPGGVAGDYDVIVNGLSVGQSSRKTSSISLGSFSQQLPPSTELQGVEGIPASQYGVLEEYAYYIVEDNFLLAKNIGVPMVFGSDNSTKILNSENGKPSIVLPGKKSFTDYNTKSSKTIEFWMRIKPNNKTPLRIFGPLGSDYGLYVSEGFITMRMGSKVSGYSVGSWYRPMLMHFVIAQESSYLLVNGEKVIEIETQGEELEKIENDWMGFFSAPSVDLFEVDCVSIFPYEVPINVAKRRFVWGQATSPQNIIDGATDESPVAIDVSSSIPSANIIYPDKERWNAAYYDNLICSDRSLSVSEYSLPNIFLSSRNENLWLNANKKVNEIESLEQKTFFTFRPGVSEDGLEWEFDNQEWNEKSYLEFDSLNFITNKVSCIYGVFKTAADIPESRPLIHIYNNLLRKRFEINIEGSELKYIYDGNELFSETINQSNYIIAGINIEKVIQSFGLTMASFFNSFDNISLYVGGAPDLDDQTYGTFEGKIFRLSISNSFNSNDILQYFNAEGFSLQTANNLLDYYATYSLLPYEEYGTFFLDVSVSAYWEEYYPLQFFSKYVTNRDETLSYGFDFLQFNIDYPSVTDKYISNQDLGEWENYLDFDIEYSYPTSFSYDLLDDIYDNYQDIEDRKADTLVIDPSTSSINMFATFQLLAEGCNEPLKNFPNTKKIYGQYIVDATKEESSADPYKAYKTKFEITDNVIIYPPNRISFENVAIVLHFIVKHDKAITNKLSITKMSLFSRSLDFVEPNKVPTVFDKNIYPATKSGIYLRYKEKNPYSLSKEYYKYLYLTENGGIEVLNKSSEIKEYITIVPINENKKSDFSVSAIQFFVKKSSVPDSLSEIFLEIDSNNKKLKFIVSTNNDGESIISCVDKLNDLPYRDVSYYQNAIQVSNIVLDNQEWNLVSIFFDTTLDFSGYTGSLNLFSGARFDNISFYSPRQLASFFQNVVRPWSKVYEDDEENILDWQYWYNDGTNERIWQQVYVYNERKQYFLSPKEIAQKYFGTNKSIVDDNSGIRINNSSEAFGVYIDRSWSSFSIKPV